MMNRKKFTIDPVGRNIKFKFDKESTKDFGGMIVDRKPATDGRIPRQKPVGSNPNVPPSKGPSGGRTPNVKGNKETAKKTKSPSAERYALKKKTVKKRPPFIVDTFKG